MNRIYYSLYGPYIVKFIALKNSLGYKYKDGGNALRLLDNLALREDVTEVPITKELTSKYAEIRPNESEKTRYNRMQILRQFAQFLCDLGLRSYIPRLPKLSRTFIPYIFSQDEIQAIFAVCDGLSPSCRNRNSGVFQIPFLIRLLYGTGIRINEALYLSYNDINLAEKYLVLRKTKNGKDRMVPMSDSLNDVCKDYLTYRSLFTGADKTERIFMLPDGTPLNQYTSYKWFRKIIWWAGISHGGRGKGPRLHDLRHTFSVHSLATMAREGLDLYHSMPLLSTYLGHQSLEATDGYVRLTAEMYPYLIKKSTDLSASVFPLLHLNQDDHETD
ncbi:MULTISPECIES: tyrosine-type recombinase/integrase [Bacteroidota]|uniref:tyrosine-type recombinase/integrase n=2 Tax=Bacteroidota/Chlorobiota group TaxID=68336 RepID=UPI000B4955E8|nr:MULTISPECIES: tyrosine-type recombinase/integrase [Bacteroidota]MCS3531240.1 integrase [Chryseobacterium sp. JUb7]MDV3619303.1 integrase [Elizabethkingia anophelis]